GIVDGIAAPTSRIQRRLACFRQLDGGADLELLDAQVDADGLEIVLYGGADLRCRIRHELGIEAVGITGLSQKLLGLGGVIWIFHGRRYVTADLAREKR